MPNQERRPDPTGPVGARNAQRPADRVEAARGLRRSSTAANLTGWEGSPKYWKVEDGGHTGTMDGKIDGHQTMDVIDFGEKGRKLEGGPAVQVRDGPPMTLRYKDFFLKRLPGDLPIIAPDHPKIPPTALQVAAPQGKDKPKKPSEK